MNKKLICMALFGSLCVKSYASKRFLQAPEINEDLINAVLDAIPDPELDGSNSIPLTFWPSEEAEIEFDLEDNGELVNVAEGAENAENGEDFGEGETEGFGETGGEDMIYSIEAEQDFSLLSALSGIERIAMPALAVASLTGNPAAGTSVGAILALGELLNGASVDNAVLGSTVGSVADAAVGISGNTGTNLVNNLGANAIGNLIKDLLNKNKNLPETAGAIIPENVNANDAISALEGLAVNANITENGEALSQLENILQGLKNETGLTDEEILAAANNALLEGSNITADVNTQGDGLLSNLGETVGDMLSGAEDVAEHVVDEVKDAVEDLHEKVDDVKDGLKDKMKEAVGKFRNIFGKH